MIDEDQSDEFWRFAEPPQVQPRSRVDHVFVLIIAAVLLATLGVVGFSQLGTSSTTSTATGVADAASSAFDAADISDTMQPAQITLPGDADAANDGASGTNTGADTSTAGATGADIVAPPTEVPSSVFVAATAVPTVPAPEPTALPAPTPEPTVAPTAEPAPAQATTDDTNAESDTGTGGGSRTAVDLTGSDLDENGDEIADGSSDSSDSDSTDGTSDSDASDSDGSDSDTNDSDTSDSDTADGSDSSDSDSSGSDTADGSDTSDSDDDESSNTDTATIGDPISSGPSADEVALLEAAMITWINSVRSEVGVAAATYHDGLSARSRQWSEIMGQQYGTLLHCDDPCGEAPIPASCPVWGENVAQGADLDVIKAALLDSPPHLENIRNGTYTHVGVGIAYISGSWWVTQNFGTC